jgi:hypothetical protein
LVKPEGEIMEKNELTIVNDEVGLMNYINNYGSGLEDKYISGMLYVAEELQRNTGLQDNVLWSVIHKKVVERTEYNLDMNMINVEIELQQFFKSPKLSDTTKKNYRKWFENYFYWCNSKKIDCRKITRMEAENYLYYLDCKYSSNSTRSMILSVSSFYTFLLIRYPEIIKVNPFYKLGLPKIKNTRRTDIVTENDINILIKELKRIGRKDVVCAVTLMERYGYRAGIFENMKIDKNGNWTSVSKEQNKSDKFTVKELKQINESGLLKLRKCTLENIVLKYTKKLVKEGKLECPFSCHDIRSYRITKDMSNAKNAIEMKLVSEKYHKNITTTMRYVRVKN